MPDFSVILQNPEIRDIVQERILERAFHDALFPRLLYRGEAAPEEWPANVGDSMVFTGVGLIKPKLKPLVPGQDPIPSDYEKEQWEATIQQWADTIDSHMPSSINAVASLFMRNAQQLGLNAGQVLNRLVRNRLFNAGLAGHTVTSAAVAASNSVPVQRLNGFTKARRPDLALGSPVRFDTVSAANPLAVQVFDTGAGDFVLRNVIAFVADTAGDEEGPGTLTVDGAAVTMAARGAVIANDRTNLVRVGGGFSVDSIGSNDLIRLADIRSAVARFWQQNVPAHPDGRFHCHLDPTSQAQVFADPEFQRLLTALPDHYMYREFALGELLGTVFFRNSENPLAETVGDGDVTIFDEDDPFAGELTSDGTAAGVPVHRPLFTGQAAIYEYYQELSQLLTEAGVTGKIGEPSITNSGIDVFADRVQLIFRSPQNRIQDIVATSWKFIGDWPVRTDVTTGDAARFKRMVVIEHGE